MQKRFSRRDFLRGTTVVGTAAIATSLLAACPAPDGAAPATQDEGAAPGEEAITIEWWTINLKSTFGEIMQSYIDEYEADHPNVTIEWVDVPGNEVAQKYATTLAGGNAPDAANMYQMARFIELGAVAPLDDLVPAEDQAAFGAFWPLARSRVNTMPFPGTPPLPAPLLSMASWPRPRASISLHRPRRGKRSLTSVAMRRTSGGRVSSRGPIAGTPVRGPLSKGSIC